MDDIQKLLNEFREFRGEFKEWKTASNTRMDKLELRVCPSHEALVNMISNSKNGEIRQEATNVKVADEQKVQNKGISDLEKGQGVQEFKLSHIQESQLNLTTIFTAFITIAEILKAYFGMR